MVPGQFLLKEINYVNYFGNNRTVLFAVLLTKTQAGSSITSPQNFFLS